MRKKLITVVVLISLLLNITHDFIIIKESSRCKASTLLIQNIIKNKCCKKSIELHQMFHFVAIFTPPLWIIYTNLKTAPNSIYIVNPKSINYKLLKPPKV